MFENPYADEARERWGETNAFQESQKRVGSYSEADWQRYKAEQAANLDAFVGAMDSGLAADSDEAKAAAEQHRLLIDQWFYPLSYEMQCGLAEMYLADPRFTEYYESRAVGLAKYVHDAIFASALASSGD